MGFINNIADHVSACCEQHSLPTVVAGGFAIFLFGAVVINVLCQLLIKNPHEPPVVFHWFPFIGSTVTYGMDPYGFFEGCRKKYGDIFTFVLLGKKTTVFLGTKGNDFILNGKLKDVCAEEVYSPLTTPVFGRGVVYDCPNAKLMEQKKFVKFGLTSESLRSYVLLIAQEVEDYVKKNIAPRGTSGTFPVPKVIGEITIYTASRSLQGQEVRDKFDSSFAELYYNLDKGFSPINFMLPSAPLPHNRKRDAAQQKMAQLYKDIIRERREKGGRGDSHDMVWNLMSCTYKDGTPLSDEEIAHMMIALLMAGQHSSASSGAWILLRLASNPSLIEELYEEQQRVLQGQELTHELLQKLELHSSVIRETLRLHGPIHSILRRVKSPMPVEGTPYVIPTSHDLLAAPGVTARNEEYFPNPLKWDPHRWDNGAVNTGEDANDEKVDYGYGLISKGGKSPYLPFGSGRHRCIGEQFAYVQLGTILATLVKLMKWEMVNAKDKVPDTDYSSLFSKPLGQPSVKYELRNAKA
ncbi:lanosterol 14-alpha-demethylase [Ascosphaera apis ARSEF 7405]|uniref:sterol 14alpha-demethylase n=1 Tax=Ascosphaera apis ARSEF 7405 TaxID=392613 RepID=A0A168A5X2_9EURO|nr:lanosterol 14-alpha-demethylase [Ascosphaera apis ARSEF 7405]